MDGGHLRGADSVYIFAVDKRQPIQGDRRMFFNQIANSIKSRGLFGTLKWGYDGYLKVNNFIVFCRDLAVPVDMRLVKPGIEMKEMSLLELRCLRAQNDRLPVEFYCDETKGFKYCYLAFIDDHPAAIYWLVRPEEKSRFLILRDGDLELNYAVVLPQYRGNRIAESLMGFILNDACSKGFKRIFSVIHVSNIPQYKPMLRLGFLPVECLTHFFVWRPKATLRYLK